MIVIREDMKEHLKEKHRRFMEKCLNEKVLYTVPSLNKCFEDANLELFLKHPDIIKILLKKEKR
jgi:hypothetical protein